MNGKEMKRNASHTEIVCMLRESAACLPLQDKAYRTEKKGEAHRSGETFIS